MPVVVITLLIIIALSLCNYGNPTRGATKVGMIINVRTEGTFCKTETAIVAGKFGGAEMRVTVPANLHAEVHRFLETQEMVKITYHTDMIRSQCSNNSGNNFLDKIEKHPYEGLNEKVDSK